MHVKFKIEDFLPEDIGDKDITSELLFKDEKITAQIVVKDDCVVAGVEEAVQIFNSRNCKTITYILDCTETRKNSVIMEIKGYAKDIFSVERTVLNFLMRMSGIATVVNKMIKKVNGKIKIAGTRKTPPGMRYYDKKAIIIGGGVPHRYGLYDAILIKSNHIRILKDIPKAIEIVKKSGKDIEIEVESVDDAITAAKCNVHTIMLDNFTPDVAKIVYKKIKEINPNIIIECSGGITLENVDKYIDACDIASSGAITHSVKAINYSLYIK